MSKWADNYTVQVSSSLLLNLPLVTDPQTGMSFYSFNMMGKSNWNKIIATELLYKFSLMEKNNPPQVLITAEAKAIGLVQEMARNLWHDKYIILRKSRKSYMKNPVSFESESITSGKNTYWLEQQDIDYIKNKSVVLVDDVLSTGGTAKAFFEIIKGVNCEIKAFCTALTEDKEWKEINGVPVISCGHIPFPGKID
jgi:adenine phosphoribosyltransferase